MRDVLPPAVFDDVSAHLRRCGTRAHRDWHINKAHEDSLTGVVFRDFATRRSRRVYVNGDRWDWRIRTQKFGSGGANSEEKLSGANGIVEVEVRHIASGAVERKGLLVQAKKGWSGTNAKLLTQVRDMERIAPGSSAAFDYGPDGYTAVDGQAVIEAKGNRRIVDGAHDMPLGKFLSDRFLACEIGLRGLLYDPRRHILHLPTATGRPDASVFLIPERMKIEIEEIGPQDRYAR
jgi:hypothetical protein